MAHSPKTVGRWLGQLEPRSRALLEEGRRLTRIQALLAEPLGPAAAHCRIGALQGEELTVYTDSPAWATRVRYGVPALLTRLRAQGLAVARIRIKVRPAAAEPTRGPRRTLSPGAARILIDASVGLPEALGAALRRLARRADRAD